MPSQEVGSIEIDIETSTVCNAACHFCPYKANEPYRAGPVMPMELFKKIIDEASQIPQVFNIRLNGLNEPLLDRFIVDRYAYMKGKIPEYGITTNGVYLTPDKTKKLIEAGVTQFYVSLNAVRPDQHKAIMGLDGKFDIVCSNIKAAINMGVDMEVRAVYNGDQFTEDDKREFVRRWGYKRYGGYGKIIKELNWTGLNRTVRKFCPSDWCIRATNNIFIRHDGVVTTCCHDPFGNGYQFGDLKTQTIKEIYNSDKYTSFREDHSLNRADKHEICKNCTRA